MHLGPLKKLYSSLIIASLLGSAITLSACQQQQEVEPSLEDEISSEQAVPMSADPAEPNEILVADDASVDEVEDDTSATVNTGVTQLIYLCSPELKVEATYKEDENSVVLVTNAGTVTLTKTNDGTNPEVFEASTAMDGGEGFVQWRASHEDRETGVIRTAGADESSVDTYNCNKT